MKTSVPVIYDCNNNCISCSIPRKQSKKPSLEEIKKDIDEILKNSDYIEINGGEPTLRKDLLKILRHIETKNPKEIRLLTNAKSFYYEDYSKKISKIKNLKIITRLYGHNPKIHDAITRTPKSFEQKIAGIKNLIKYKVPIELRILLHKMNYNHFKDIVEFLILDFKKDDFNKIIIMNSKLTETARENKNKIAEKLTVLAEVLEEPIKKLIKKGFNIEIHNFPYCILPKPLWKFSKESTSRNWEIVFTEKCKTCIKEQGCAGIWKSYLDIFGSNEFCSRHKTTKNFYLKLYYDKKRFIKTKEVYRYFKDNNIPIANYSFYDNYNIQGSKGCSLCEHQENKITLKDYYIRYGISNMDTIFDHIIEILEKIHNLPITKSPWVNSFRIIQRKNMPRHLSGDVLKIYKQTTQKSKEQSYENKRIIFDDFNINNIILTDKKDINCKDIFLIDLDEVCIGDSLTDISKFLFYSSSKEFTDLFLKKYIDKKMLNKEIITKIIPCQLNFIKRDGIIINKKIRDYIAQCFKKRQPLIYKKISRLK